MKRWKGGWLFIALLAPALWANEPRRVKLEIPPADQAPKRTKAVARPSTMAGGVKAIPVLPEALPGLKGAKPPSPPVLAPESGPSPAEVFPRDQTDEAGSAVEVEQGKILFDQAQAAAPDSGDAVDAASGVALDDVVRRAAERPLEAGVFIQQEQEGSLIASDPRDSSGNFFLYYRPVQMRPELMAQVQEGLGGLAKIGYGLSRSLNFWSKDPYKVWDAWPVEAKLDYLVKLEAAVAAEKGPEAAWKGKESLLLERVSDAPDFLAKNPHFEAAPASHKDDPRARFLQPEIVSAKDQPAATIAQALRRTRLVIAQTGHAGTQYHVFLKAKPAALAAQMRELQSALQLVNNLLFARAALGSLQNVTHASLLPWHRGRSERVARLIGEARAGLHAPEAADADSEKHAPVGLRYWGLEGGKAVISFELRGASLPWEQPRGGNSFRGLEAAPRPERSYARAQQYLTFLSLYAERLARGRAHKFSEPALDLNLEKAETMLRRRARELGLPAGSYYGVADFAKRLSGFAEVPPGYLFPFAASAPDSPSLRSFMDELLKESSRVRALDRPGGGLSEESRHIEYLFWMAYRDWAQDYEAKTAARFEALFRATAAE